MYNCNWMGCINPFKPIVFDDEISVLQMVATLTNRVNDITAFTQDLLSNAKSYTDTEISKLKTYVDKEIISVTSQFDALEKRLNIKIDTNVDELNQKIITTKNELIKYIDNAVSGFLQKLNLYYELLHDYADHLNNKTKVDVDIALDQLKKQINKINENGYKILNPTNGMYELVGKTVTDVYDAIRLCLTAGEADITKIPVEVIETFTVEQFERWSKWYFDYKNQYLITSPTTGEKVTHQVAINELYNYWQNGSYTAGEWDELNVTAGEVEEKNITAYNFDFHCRRFIS